MTPAVSITMHRLYAITNLIVALTDTDSVNNQPVALSDTDGVNNIFVAF